MKKIYVFLALATACEFGSVTARADEAVAQFNETICSSLVGMSDEIERAQERLAALLPTLLPEKRAEVEEYNRGFGEDLLEMRPRACAGTLDISRTALAQMHRKFFYYSLDGRLETSTQKKFNALMYYISQVGL